MEKPSQVRHISHRTKPSAVAQELGRAEETRGGDWSEEETLKKKIKNHQHSTRQSETVTSFHPIIPLHQRVIFHDISLVNESSKAGSRHSQTSSNKHGPNCTYSSCQQLRSAEVPWNIWLSSPEHLWSAATIEVCWHIFLAFNCLETSHAHCQTAAATQESCTETFHRRYRWGGKTPAQHWFILKVEGGFLWEGGAITPSVNVHWRSCPALKNWPDLENSEAAALRCLIQCHRPYRVPPPQPDLKHFINLPECCLLVNDSRGGSVLRNISSCSPAAIAPLQAVNAIMKSDQRHFITPPTKPEPWNSEGERLVKLLCDCRVTHPQNLEDPGVKNWRKLFPIFSWGKKKALRAWVEQPSDH